MAVLLFAGDCDRAPLPAEGGSKCRCKERTDLDGDLERMLAGLFGD
jgi:hypothetical protein